MSRYLRIEPGACYVIEAPWRLSREEADAIRERWEALTFSRAIVLDSGMRVARASRRQVRRMVREKRREALVAARSVV